MQMTLSRRNAELFEKRDQLNLKIAHLGEYSIPEYKEVLEADCYEIMSELDTNRKIASTLSLMQIDIALAENLKQLEALQAK